MPAPVLFYIFATCLGLVLGSFYNVCIHRSITEESISNPKRSKCPKCGHFLSWWENIPLLSFLFILRGRCFHCRAPISWRYPAVEAISAALALFFALKFGMSLQWVVLMAFSGLFIVLSFIDLATMTLPLYPMLVGAVAALICGPLVLGVPWLDAFMAAGIGAGGFWLIGFLYKKIRGFDGLGDGDMWLMLVLGPLVGLKMLPLVILSSGIFLLASSMFFKMFNYAPVEFGLDRGGDDSALRDGEKVEEGAATAEEKEAEATREDHEPQDEEEEGSFMQMALPYGPFLCAGTLLALLAGNEIMAWYLSSIQ